MTDYKLVPREPTQEMVDDAVRRYIRMMRETGQVSDYFDVWRWMYDAAPTINEGGQEAPLGSTTAQDVAAPPSPDDDLVKRLRFISHSPSCPDKDRSRCLCEQRNRWDTLDAIERLTDDVARWQEVCKEGARERDGLRAEIAGMARVRDALLDAAAVGRREREALRADAERYRWLRNSDADWPSVYGSAGSDDTGWFPIDGAKLDAAIDKAREK